MHNRAIIVLNSGCVLEHRDTPTSQSVTSYIATWPDVYTCLAVHDCMCKIIHVIHRTPLEVNLNRVQRFAVSV